MPNKTVSIIIPALNEEDTIAKVIDEIPKKDLQKVGYRVEIIVIDNNSTDGTAEIAKEKGVKVIAEPVKGKGRAIRTAFKSVSGDFIFMLDADYTYPATYIPRMLEVLQEGHDVVIGSRLKGQMGKGAMSKMHLMGNRLLVFIANILYGTRISDLCTGYWGLTRRVIDNMELDAKGFELEAAMFAEITKKGYRIAEVPIFYRRRATPSKLSSLKDGFKIVWTLLKKRFQRT
jgi:dolichol-phosphate mannosyltransferase